jgi:heptosyltransferase-3
MTPTDPEPVLLSRTDSIGDVVLTLPMAGWIKRRDPRREVIFLGRDYTRPILEACEHVDRVVSWDEIGAQAPGKAVSALRSLRAGAIVHVFPRREIARLARAAGIPQRIGVNRRWYHLLECNR